jgi:hypothetical protein
MVVCVFMVFTYTLLCRSHPRLTVILLVELYMDHDQECPTNCPARQNVSCHPLPCHVCLSKQGGDGDHLTGPAHVVPPPAFLGKEIRVEGGITNITARRDRIHLDMFITSSG